MEDIFKESANKKEFSDLPETVITGVVGATGPGAGKVPTDKYWSLHLPLIAWKELGGELNNSSLILSKDLTDDELKDVQAKIKKESLVQFKVKLSKTSPFGDTRAQLISILETPDDFELRTALAEFKEPVEITHHIFGSLVLDRSVDCFEGKINWLNESIRISVSVDEDDGSLESSLQTIEALYGDARNW